MLGTSYGAKPEAILLVQFKKYVKENVETLNHGQQTFYAVNGSSIIDLILTADGIRGWKKTLSIDTDAELLTGYTQITGQLRPNFRNI